MTGWIVVLALAGWGPEQPVEPLGAPVAPVEFRDGVAAASWGNDYVVAWRDGRFARTPVVMAARVLGDAGLPDPLGIVAGQFNSSRVSVGTNGSRAVIAWEHDESIYSRMLASDGTWLAPTRLVSAGRCPFVIFGPGGGAVVFENGKLQAVRFLGDGTQLDATPVDLTPANVPWGTCARGATDGASATRFLVAWRDATTLSSVMLHLVGGPDAVRQLDVGIPYGHFDVVRVATDDFLVVSGWDPPPMTIYGAYEVTSTTRTEQTLFGPGDWQGVNLAPCSLGLCMVARRGTTSIDVTPMSLDAGVLTPLHSPFPIRTNDWSLAGNGGAQLLAAWSASNAIRTLVTGPDLSLGTPQQVGLQSAGSIRPSLAANGDLVLLAWLEMTATGSTVRARRFDGLGAPIDQTVLALGGLATNYEKVKVLATQTGWVVALFEAGGFSSLQSVGLNGSPGPERRVGPTGLDTGYATDGERVFITQKFWDGTVWDPLMVTVERDGGVRQRKLQQTAAKEHLTSLAVASDGSKLALSRDVDPSGVADGILAGVRVDPGDVLVDDGGVRFTPPGSEAVLESETVSVDAATFLVVWRSYAQLFMQQVSGASGAATPPAALISSPGNSRPAQQQITGFARGGLVVWANGTDGGIIAQLISTTSGAPVAGEEVSVAAQGFNGWPTVAVTPAAVWFAFSRADTTANTMQTVVRRYERDPTGAVCQADWQCVSSSCQQQRCAAPPSVDAGPETDGGQPFDGGPPMPDDDGGTAFTARRTVAIGCGCTEGSPEALLLTALLLWTGRRVRTARA